MIPQCLPEAICHVTYKVQILSTWAIPDQELAPERITDPESAGANPLPRHHARKVGGLLGQLPVRPCQASSRGVQSSSSPVNGVEDKDPSTQGADERSRSSKDADRISIGLSTARAFADFHCHTREAMSKGMPSFYPASKLCAEFLRVIHADGTLPDAQENMLQTWAKHAMATSSKTQKMITMTEEWQPQSPGIYKRFFGYLIDDFKVQVWVMQYRSDVEPNTEHTTFLANQVADLCLREAQGVESFVKWHIQILQWARKDYGIPYVARLAHRKKAQVVFMPPRVAQ
ncbi:MAG: hypothetical protein Q9181_006019, partial [Wetmoreana brouardii]